MDSQPDDYERSRATRAIDALCGLIVIAFIIAPLFLAAAVEWYFGDRNEPHDPTSPLA
jgi:hypothetical protein